MSNKTKKAAKAKIKTEAVNPELEASIVNTVASEAELLGVPPVPESEQNSETPPVPESEQNPETPAAPEAVAVRKWTIPKNVGEKKEVVTDRPITYFDRRDLSGKGTKMSVGSRVSVQVLALEKDGVPVVRIRKGDCKRTFYASLENLNGLLDPVEEAEPANV